MPHWASGICRAIFTLLQTLAFIAAITSAMIAYSLYKHHAPQPPTAPAIGPPGVYIDTAAVD